MTGTPSVTYGDESLGYVKNMSVKVLPAINKVCVAQEGIYVSAKYVLGNADLYKQESSDCSMTVVPSIQLHPTVQDLCFGSLNAVLTCAVVPAFIGEQSTIEDEIYPQMPLHLWWESSPVLYYVPDSHALNGQTELMMKAFINEWRDSQPK